MASSTVPADAPASVCAPPAFFSQRTDLLNANPAPATSLTAPNQYSLIQLGIAREYNRLGGLLARMASLLHTPLNLVLALWFLGPQLELILGRMRYLGLYLLAGLVGSAAVYWLSPVSTPTLGASGAIFGLMGALLVFMLKVRADVNQLLMWIGLNIAFTFFGANISWQGHLGGFLAGAAMGAVLVFAPRGPRRAPVQFAGMAAIALVVVVAIVARILTLQ